MNLKGNLLNIGILSERKRESDLTDQEFFTFLLHIHFCAADSGETYVSPWNIASMKYGEDAIKEAREHYLKTLKEKGRGEYTGKVKTILNHRAKLVKKGWFIREDNSQRGQDGKFQKGHKNREATVYNVPENLWKYCRFFLINAPEMGKFTTGENGDSSDFNQFPSDGQWMDGSTAARPTGTAARVTGTAARPTGPEPLLVTPISNPKKNIKKSEPKNDDQPNSLNSQNLESSGKEKTSGKKENAGYSKAAQTGVNSLPPNGLADFCKIMEMERITKPVREEWARLCNIYPEEIPLILQHAPAYVQANPIKTYRKKPINYLKGEEWKMEVVDRRPGMQTTAKKQLTRIRQDNSDRQNFSAI